jgi:hypothetical protein
MASTGPIQADATIEADHFQQVADLSATRSDDEGLVPVKEADGFLHAKQIKDVADLSPGEDIDGTTTPKAVFKAGAGVFLAESDVSGKTRFDGFVRQNITGGSVQFLNGLNNTGTGTTISHTVNAGTDVLVIVRINYALVGTTSGPTGVTWNGNTMTLLHENHGSYAGMSVYYYLAGDVASNTTGDIVITGGSTPAGTMAVNFEFVDQSNP